MSDFAAFKLGYDAWPDWFHDKHCTNEITTHNVDGRYSGGPDYALINTPKGQIRALFGDLIVCDDNGEVSTAASPSNGVQIIN